MRVYGTLRLDNRSNVDEGWLKLHESGYVYAESEHRWYPPHRVSYITPSDGSPLESAP